VSQRTSGSAASDASTVVSPPNSTSNQARPGGSRRTFSSSMPLRSPSRSSISSTASRPIGLNSSSDGDASAAAKMSG
jgi:hypothetical protein